MNECEDNNGELQSHKYRQTHTHNSAHQALSVFCAKLENS